VLEVFYYDYYEDFSKNELDGIEELIIKALQTTFKDPRNKFRKIKQETLQFYIARMNCQNYKFYLILLVFYLLLW